MQTCAPAVTQTASYLRVRSRCRRFIIRSASGFLAAGDGPNCLPVTAVPDHRDAVHFVDFDAACTRARSLTELGWLDLRIVEVFLPLCGF